MAFRVVSGIMAVMFLWSAALQFNDPDPLRWALIYGAAGVVSALGVRGRDKFPLMLPAIVAVVALAWALIAGSGTLGEVGFGGLFQSFEMKDEGVEQGREFIGLLVIAGWMALMVLFRRGAKQT